MGSNRERTYSELSKLETYEERCKYLSLSGEVGADTFGFDRYLNQQMYKSKEWRDVRDKVIVRDKACDLGIPGRELTGAIYVHHINPIGVADIKDSTEYLLNPEYLVCTSLDTHNAIHYGRGLLQDKNKVVTREKDDTCPWKHR